MTPLELLLWAAPLWVPALVMLVYELAQGAHRRRRAKHRTPWQ